VPYAPTPYLKIEADGPVTVLTMNNPDMRNAFVDDLHEALQEVWLHLSNDRDVRAVVLTGEGKAFSAGGNIPDFIRSYEDPVHRRNSLRGARRLMDAMAEFPKPVVAAVNGPAVGLGCSVAVSCDIVLIADNTYMADTHVNIGLVCGDGGAAAWPLMMSLLKAKEYLLTGERIPAAEAVNIGLANRTVPADQLMKEALVLAHKLASQPAQAIQETKRALNIHLQQAISMVAPFALSAEGESFATDDIRDTIAKFTKK
jgi:enoyl-CoA hydratase